MNPRSCRLTLEAMESREVPSYVISADFNNDLRADTAELTSATTITVSLANPDGSYTVSAVLTAPKNRTITYMDVYDYNGDGNMDIYALSPGGSGGYTLKWLSNGDGTFGPGTIEKYQSPFGKVGHGGLW
jgi:hypothetical protein